MSGTCLAPMIGNSVNRSGTSWAGYRSWHAERGQALLSCLGMPCHAIPCCAVRCAMLSRAMPCSAMPCHAMPPTSSHSTKCNHKQSASAS
eukprot:70178-Chlamydomonas_euryale.AAC.5